MPISELALLHSGMHLVKDSAGFLVLNSLAVFCEFCALESGWLTSTSEFPLPPVLEVSDVHTDLFVTLQ